MDKTRRRCLRSLAALPLALHFGKNLRAGERPEIKKSDRCPVCGMFVYKYPKWVGQVILKDGTAYFYDGAKDLFKHYFDFGKYTPGKSAQEIAEIYVTDYYEVELVEAKTAYYVIGSDVLGPMGHELLPFKDKESAEEFKADHEGKQIIGFQDVSMETLKRLDASE